MGLGSFFSDIFGGGNSYQNVNSPIIGNPLPGETPDQFKARQQQAYNARNAAFQNQLNQAYGEAQGIGKRQGSLADVLQGRMGQNIDFGAANQTLGQNQDLINQLMAQGRGEGPNPALDQLRMTTNQNIASQAGAVGSARGMNPGLAARLAGQQGANLNQQAAGQAALQSAQQQLGAQSAAGGLLGQQAGLQSQMAGMNAQQQANYAQMLGSVLNAQRQQAMGQQAQTATEQTNYQQMLQNAYNAMNNINAGVAAQNANTQGQYGMGIMGGLSSGLSAIGAMLNKGGRVPGYAEGGEVEPYPKGDKKVGVVMKEFGKGKLKSSSGAPVTNPKQAIAIALSEQRRAEGMSEGGQVPESFVEAVRKRGMKMAGGGIAQYNAFSNGDPLASELNLAGGNTQGENMMQKGMGDAGSKLSSFLGKAFASAPAMGDFGAAGGMGGAAELAPAMALASSGGKVGGKAKVDGDSAKNDNVPVLLSPGEIVIPRSVQDSPESAHAFLDKIMKKKVSSYGQVLAKKRMAMGGYCG